MQPLRIPNILCRSDIEYIDQLLNRSGRLLKRRTLIVGEVDLDDLLDSILAKLDRYANKEVADAVLALEENSTGQDLFLILQDRLSHLDGPEARCVIRRPRLKKPDDLGTAVRRS